VVWAIDFQCDSTIDGKAIEIASMLDEHTRESLLNLVERSITAERLIDELQRCFVAAGGSPMVLRMDIHTEFGPGHRFWIWIGAADVLTSCLLSVWVAGYRTWAVRPVENPVIGRRLWRSDP